MDDRRITCAQCGTPIAESTNALLRNGAPCPNCGSLNRVVHVTGIAAVGMVATATVTVDQPQSAEVSGSAHDATVETSTTESTAASVTSLGLPTRSYDIRISSLETDGSESCLVEVFNESGTLLVSGGGTNEVDALLEVILYMLPQHHPEYPQPSPTLDDE